LFWIYSQKFTIDLVKIRQVLLNGIIYLVWFAIERSSPSISRATRSIGHKSAVTIVVLARSSGESAPLPGNGRLDRARTFFRRRMDDFLVLS
jgi:hypothetical protein